MKLHDSAEAEFTGDERAEAAIELSHVKRDQLSQALEVRLWGDAQAFLAAQKNSRNTASTTASTTLFIEDAPARTTKIRTPWTSYGFAAAAAALFVLGGARLYRTAAPSAGGHAGGASAATFAPEDHAFEIAVTSDALTFTGAPVCRAGCEIGLLTDGKFSKIVQIPSGAAIVSIDAATASTLQMSRFKVVVRTAESSSDIALVRRWD
jgi:hypothetical protein